MNKNLLLTFLCTLLGVLFTAFGLVMFCGSFEGWIGTRLGLPNKKNEILVFLGIGMGGVLLAIQALIANRRVKAMEDQAKAQSRTAKAQADAAKAQAKATEEQVKANQTTEQGLRQERLKNAIEHLGQDKEAVRLGGIYELFHLAQDTEALRQTVLDILCAHIRRTTREGRYRETHKSEPSEEIQSLLTLLFLQEYEVFKGCRINLQGSWLNGAKLRGAHLEKAVLLGAYLQKAILIEAQLYGANLEEAHLQGADLSEAQMHGASLSGAQMHGANLFMVQLHEANLSGVQAHEVILARAHLYKADLSQAQFYRANLSMAHLHGANLSGANLREADLSEAHLYGADLDLAYLYGTGFGGACLHGGNFRGARLYGAHFHGARLHGANLDRARLYGANLDRAQLHGAILGGAYLHGATLSETHLHGVASSHLVSTVELTSGATFTERIRTSIGQESDLSRTIFSGGLSQEYVDSSAEGFEGFREKLKPHIGKPESHQPPEGAITGAYTEEEAEQWIAEFNEAMSEVPEAVDGF